MKSSIPVDPDAEDHVAEAMECFRILNSPEGLKIKGTLDMDAEQSAGTPSENGRKGLAIWQDLKIHMMAHVAAGKAKGLMFPPPLGGPPPLPMPPGKPGAAGAGPVPPLTPPPAGPGGSTNAAIA
jgi:hypothetical protein